MFDIGLHLDRAPLREIRQRRVTRRAAARGPPLVMTRFTYARHIVLRDPAAGPGARHVARCSRPARARNAEPRAQRRGTGAPAATGRGRWRPPPPRSAPSRCRRRRRAWQPGFGAAPAAAAGAAGAGGADSWRRRLRRLSPSVRGLLSRLRSPARLLEHEHHLPDFDLVAELHLDSRRPSPPTVVGTSIVALSVSSSTIG